MVYGLNEGLRKCKYFFRITKINSAWHWPWSQDIFSIRIAAVQGNVPAEHLAYACLPFVSAYSPANHSPWSPKYLATAQGGNQQAGWHKYTYMETIYSETNTAVHSISANMKTSQYGNVSYITGLLSEESTVNSHQKGPVTLLYSISHQHITIWKCIPHYWPFVRGLQWSPVDPLTKGMQLWCGFFCFCFSVWSS